MRTRLERALLVAGAADRSLLVAASGGLDSTVLAHLLADLREPLGIDLVLAHVNHGLRGAASDADVQAVERLAQKLGAPFASARVDPESLRTGQPSRSRPTVQEAGRTLRRVSRHAGQNWFSAKGLGRGPTIDMWPTRSLKN